MSPPPLFLPLLLSSTEKCWWENPVLTPWGLDSFYYADQRSPEGKPMYTGLDGDAHAETYWDLADSEAKGKSILTFVKDQGIKAFPKI